MSDVEAEFDKIDKLLGLTPFFRCPSCGKRDEDGAGTPTFFLIRTVVDFQIEVDDSRKEMVVDLASMDASGIGLEEMQLVCNECQHFFPFPIGWTYRYK